MKTRTRWRPRGHRVVLSLAGVLLSALAASATPPEEPKVEVVGTVRDTGGRPLPDAQVALGEAVARTDAGGAFRLVVGAGLHELEVSLEGFERVRRELRISRGLGPIEVVLNPPLRLREDVVVQAVRAEERTPITKTDLDRQEIALLHRGQEMPFLLGVAPAVNFQSDTGIAAGYSYFTIRGIAQTRLNITLDGVPLQDPEDQALYFANFGDFASVVDSIQVQRGVGTSGIGSASYGGSVNFASVNPAETAGLDAQVGAGSWGTARGTVGVDSGRFGGGWALQGRFSAQTTDGFRDRSGVEQRTLFYGASRQDDRSLLKLFGFSGRERTELAYLATDEPTLASDLRFNPLSPEEKDRFGQDFFQAQYTRLLGASTTLTAQGYYNGAQGWFRIVDVTGAVQEFGLDGHFVGGILGGTHRRGRLGLNFGIHVNDFTRDHFMDIVGGSRAYLNTGLKNEASGFLKATWDAGRARFWGDAQVRHARFEYRGDLDLGSVEWTFFNPRGGVRFDPSPSLGLYASIGRMSREPARSDMLNGEDNASIAYDLAAISPERVFDLEAGVELRRGSFLGRASLYAMEFHDEIALSGELSEIGLPVRRNVDRSHRRGLELDLHWSPRPELKLGGTASFNRSRIAEWTQYYDVYDTDGAWLDSVPIVHQDVPALLSPPVIATATIDWLPRPELGLGLAGRWVDRAHLDNTGRDEFRTPSFLNLDAQATLGLSRLLRRGEPRLRVQVTNLLGSRRQWPSGYSYLYFVRDAGGESFAGTSYYYPLAERSAYVTLDLRF